MDRADRYLISAELFGATAQARDVATKTAMPHAEAGGLTGVKESRMSWLIGQWNSAWMVALKTLLLYVTALGSLRVTTRRTLAQMSLFDFVTALAIGAVIGRTATAGETSFVQGAVALVTLIIVHRIASLLRYHPVTARLMDHRIRVLLAHGHVRTRQLWICGLTVDDLRAALRQRGVQRLGQVRYVLYERTGGVTIVLNDEQPGELVTAAIRSAPTSPTTPDVSSP